MIDNSVNLAPGTTRVLGDIKTFKGIRVTYYRFGTGQMIGNVRLPDFTKTTEMRTKKEPTMTDEEFKKAIGELAKKDAEKGQFHNETKEYLELMDGYISSVSPDRESLITNSMKQIFGKTNSKKPAINEKENILHQTLKLMDKIKSKNKTSNDAAMLNKINDNSMFGKVYMEGDKLEYVEFYGNDGKMLAQYSSNTGWLSNLTEEEGVRLREFSAIYNEAWNSTHAEIDTQNNNISMSKSTVSGNAIDVVG